MKRTITLKFILQKFTSETPFFFGGGGLGGSFSEISLKQKMAELWSKIFLLAITSKMSGFCLIQNYTDNIWNYTSPKMQISRVASFF